MLGFLARHVARLLRSSRLVCGEEAAGLVAATPVYLPAEGEVPAVELLQTYSARLEILHLQTGPYATQLRESMSELCGRLKRFEGSCCFVQIEAERPYTYVALLSSDGQLVLGCMKVQLTNESKES